MPQLSKIGKLAKQKTRAQFATELSNHTALTSAEIETLFPLKSDREALLELLKIVNSASEENEKKAELAAKIGSVGGAVLTIAKKFATGL